MSELTREQILAMSAGRELDALVAEKVMGWKVQFMGEGLWGWMYSEPDRNCWNNVPRFSTDISAAVEVVEELNGKYGFSLGRAGDYEPDRKWNARIGKNEWIEADTAPEVICKAALLAVMGL